MKRKIRAISFTDKEEKIREYLDSQLNKSKYMKILIKNDMEKQSEKPDK